MHILLRACNTILVAGLLLATDAGLSAQATSLDDTLSRMATYVGDYVQQFANIVAVETYEQRINNNTDVNPPGVFSGSPRAPIVRRLRSEVLLVRYPAPELDWMIFRDVAEVNGQRFVGAEGRLIGLFGEPAPDAVQRAGQIAFESAKYHIPGASFAVTNPILVVALAQAHYQPRLQFKLGGEERSLGAGVRIVAFEERKGPQPPADTNSGGRQGSPSLLTEGPVRGSIWLEVATGRIVKTEARIGSGRDLSTTIATFAPDQRLGIMVPREMRTTWVLREPDSLRQLIVNGIAKYAEFRRFAVRTDSPVITLPQR